MKHIKLFKIFLNSINESVENNPLLKTINAENVLIGDVLDFNSENFNDIEVMSNDPEFLRKLDKKGFKKNNIEFTKECETFLPNFMDIKFFLIFKKEDSELEPKPEYMVIQTKYRNKPNWESIKMYKVNDNIRNFYDKLSSRTIEITKGGKNYIYRTSNAGNDWSLQNIQNRDNIYKDIMSNDEIRATLKDGQSKIKVVS